MKRARSQGEAVEMDSTFPRAKRPRLSPTEASVDNLDTEAPLDSTNPPPAPPRKGPLTLHLTLKHEDGRASAPGTRTGTGSEEREQGNGQDTPDLGDLCRHLLTVMEEYRDNDGRLVSEIFKELPDKRQYRDYYTVISQPIALKNIHKNISSGRYSSLDDLKSDVELMFRNAKQYNAPKSMVYEDAVALQALFRRELASLTKTRSSSTRRSASSTSLSLPGAVGTSNDDEETGEALKEKCKALLAVMKELKDDVGNNLTSIFRELPSKQLYPDYYEKIERPIAIKVIQRKISDDKYTNLEEFRTDVELMFANAKAYNLPKSSVYQDAVVLLKRFREEYAAMTGGGGRRSITSARRAGGSALNDGGTDGVGDDNTSDLIEVYKSLVRGIESYADADARMLASMFVQLPSRIEYPDYYRVIEEPISLKEINRSIELGRYGTLDQLKRDVDLMFRNAKTYNAPKSQIYEDATQLQKFFRDEFNAAKRNLDHAPPSSARRERADSETHSVASMPRKSKDRSRTFEEERKEDLAEAKDEYFPAGVTKIKFKKKFEPMMLFDAIQRDDFKTLRKLLLDNSVDPNSLHPFTLGDFTFTWNPLHAAAFYGAEECLRTLIEMGADIEMPDTWYGSRPLGWAAFGGHADVAKVLVMEFGADRDATNVGGQRAIDVAADPANPQWQGVLVNDETVKTKSRSRTTADVEYDEESEDGEGDDVVKPRLKITMRKSKDGDEDSGDAKGKRKESTVKEDEEMISVDDEVPGATVGEGDDGATSKPRVRVKRKPLWPLAGGLPVSTLGAVSGMPGVPGVPGKIDKPVNPVFSERASTAHILSHVVMTPSATSDPRTPGFCFEQAIPAPESGSGTAVSVPADVDRLGVMVFFHDVAPAPVKIFGPGGSIKTSNQEVFPTVRRYLVIRWNGSIVDLQPFFGEREDGGSGFIATTKMRNGLNTLEIFARERRKRERDDDSKKGKEKEKEKEEDDDANAPAKRRGRKPKEDDVFEHSFRYFVTRS
ncbi:hypothetical protein HDU93_007625 [Gonapodya sp. JEL0774]|nr:hypothetical protein HDU93_007625 [Gonapodya sp. JEL0774]